MAPCPHLRQKSRCRECGGVSICEHGRRKDRCVKCGGVQICAHKQRKSECTICAGVRICAHGRRKTRCVSCGGSEICVHRRRRSECKICRGDRICNHGYRKDSCAKCKKEKEESCHIALRQQPLLPHELFSENWGKEKGRCERHMLCEFSTGHDGPCFLPPSVKTAMVYAKQVQTQIKLLLSK